MFHAYSSSVYLSIYLQIGPSANDPRTMPLVMGPGGRRAPLKPRSQYIDTGDRIVVEKTIQEFKEVWGKLEKDDYVVFDITNERGKSI